MSGLFWRILIALVCVLALAAIIPALARVLGFPLDADVVLIVRVCIAAIAVLYIIRGPNPPFASV